MTFIGMHDKQGLRALSSMDWTCREATLGWRVEHCEGDAAPIFERVFGIEPDTHHTNKFATASMPCRSWAHGVRTGEELDLRLGLDGNRRQLSFAFEAGAAPLSTALARLKCARERLEGEEGANMLELSIALDLTMGGRMARRPVEAWLDTVGQADGAAFQRHEYQFDIAPHGVARVVCALDGRQGADQVDMRIELTGVPDLFGAYEAMLSAKRLNDIAAMGAR